MDDDEERAKAVNHEVGMNIDALSVDELSERIGLLEAEIARLKVAVEARGMTRTAAESLFKF